MSKSHRFQTLTQNIITIFFLSLNLKTLHSRPLPFLCEGNGKNTPAFHVRQKHTFKHSQNTITFKSFPALFLLLTARKREKKIKRKTDRQPCPEKPAVHQEVCQQVPISKGTRGQRRPNLEGGDHAAPPGPTHYHLAAAERDASITSGATYLQTTAL